MAISGGESYGPGNSEQMAQQEISTWKEEDVSQCCKQENVSTSLERAEYEQETNPMDDITKSLPCGGDGRFPNETTVQTGVDTGKKQSACMQVYQDQDE